MQSRSAGFTRVVMESSQALAALPQPCRNRIVCEPDPYAFYSIAMPSSVWTTWVIPPPAIGPHGPPSRTHPAGARRNERLPAANRTAVLLSARLHTGSARRQTRVTDPEPGSHRPEPH